MNAIQREEPNAFRIMKVLELANNHLRALQSEVTDPDADPDEATEAETMLEKLKARGADLGGVMEELLLAANVAKHDAEAIKSFRTKLKLRLQRRERRNEVYRNAVMAIMAEWPELFPPSPKSKALAAFKSALVDARVQRGPQGVIIIDENKVMADERFVKRILNEAAIKEAVVKDGEVIDGTELENGAPFLVVKVT
jgi:hypothetical protein